MRTSWLTAAMFAALCCVGGMIASADQACGVYPCERVPPVLPWDCGGACKGFCICSCAWEPDGWEREYCEGNCEFFCEDCCLPSLIKTHENALAICLADSEVGWFRSLHPDPCQQCRHHQVPEDCFECCWQCALTHCIAACRYDPLSLPCTRCITRDYDKCVREQCDDANVDDGEGSLRTAVGAYHAPGDWTLIR